MNAAPLLQDTTRERASYFACENGHVNACKIVELNVESLRPLQIEVLIDNFGTTPLVDAGSCEVICQLTGECAALFPLNVYSLPSEPGRMIRTLGLYHEALASGRYVLTVEFPLPADQQHLREIFEIHVQ